VAAVASQLLPDWSPAAAATLTEDQLPKGYQDLSSRLVKALREAIETDMGDASEREVRRRADGAKGLVREWIGNWRDSPLVTSSASHRELTGTIQDLGQYYTKNGQRARMSTVAGNALLKRLDAAAVTLPP
jgi:hypothetical protein